MNLLPKFPKTSAQSQQQSTSEIERSLKQYEAKIGGQLFGPVPAGHYRSFFCLDRRTWIWHEEWNDKQGKRQLVTTKYSVIPGSVLKSQNGHPYQRLSKDEARNLYKAVGLYRHQVGTAYQRLMQTA